MINAREELKKIRKQKKVPAYLDLRVDGHQGNKLVSGIIVGVEYVASEGVKKIKVEHEKKIDGRKKYMCYDPYALIYHIDDDEIIFYENGIKHVIPDVKTFREFEIQLN
jgi:hypothetical protein